MDPREGWQEGWRVGGITVLGYLEIKSPSLPVGMGA